MSTHWATHAVGSYASELAHRLRTRAPKHWKRRANTQPGAGGGAVKKEGAKCPHKRIRSLCKRCGGSRICKPAQAMRGGGHLEHNRQRSTCKQFGRSSNCAGGRAFASTTSNETSASSAAGHDSASTTEEASARNGVGQLLRAQPRTEKMVQDIFFFSLMSLY